MDSGLSREGKYFCKMGLDGRRTRRANQHGSPDDARLRTAGMAAAVAYSIPAALRFGLRAGRILITSTTTAEEPAQERIIT